MNEEWNLSELFQQLNDSGSDTEDDRSAVNHGIESTSTSDNVDRANAAAVKFIEFQSPYLHRPISIVEERSKGIGYQLWPAATFFCRFLGEQASNVLPGPPVSLTCLELGAGVGLVGLFMAALGCERTWVTDLPEVLPILQRNVEINPELAPRITVHPLTWGTTDWKFWLPSPSTKYYLPDKNGDASMISECTSVLGWGKLVVLLADCVYWPELFEPLLVTLSGLCDRCGATVLMSHTRRWKKDGKFFSLASKRLVVSKIHERVGHEHDGARVVMRVYRMSSRMRSVEHKKEIHGVPSS